MELSPREKEVAELIAKGQANKQIASKLGISHFTVSSYIRRMMAKTETRNRTELVLNLYQSGKLGEL